MLHHSLPPFPHSPAPGVYDGQRAIGTTLTLLRPISLSVEKPSKEAQAEAATEAAHNECEPRKMPFQLQQQRRQQPQQTLQQQQHVSLFVAVAAVVVCLSNRRAIRFHYNIYKL